MLVLKVWDDQTKRYSIADSSRLPLTASSSSASMLLCHHHALQSEVSLHAQMKHMRTFTNRSLLAELQPFPRNFLTVWPVQCFYMSHQKAATATLSSRLMD